MIKLSALILVLATFAVGCGGNDPGDGLIGTWGIEQDDGCVVATKFDGTNYSVGQICALVSGGFGFDVENGVYQATATTFTSTATTASCHAHDHSSETDQWSRSGSNLIISNPGKGFALTFAPLPAGMTQTGVVVRTGCWDGDTFTFAPVTAL